MNTPVISWVALGVAAAAPTLSIIFFIRRVRGATRDRSNRLLAVMNATLTDHFLCLADHQAILTRLCVAIESDGWESLATQARFVSASKSKLPRPPLLTLGE